MSDAEARSRFPSPKLPQGRERERAQEGYQEPPPGRIIWNWEDGEAKGAITLKVMLPPDREPDFTTALTFRRYGKG